MNWDYKQLEETIHEEEAHIDEAYQLEEFRIKYLGRKGLIPSMYASLAQLSKEEKPLVGKQINDLRRHIDQIIERKKKTLKPEKKRSKATDLDVTLPGVFARRGHQHLITQTIEQICSIFERMGFVVQEGPEIETEFNNF
mgnify:CR=1 FL=1